MKVKVIYLISFFFFVFYSCSKNVKKDEVFEEIEIFSGFKIEEKYVDSIIYDYDYSYVDDVTLYTLYVNEKHIDKINEKLSKLPNFTNYNDTLISYSIFNNGQIKQVNFKPKSKMIYYSIANL